MRKLSVVVIIALIAAMAVSALPVFGKGKTETPADSVFIVKGSTINLVSRESSIPVVVSSKYAGEVRVVVHLRSTSPKVLIEESEVAIVVPGGTTVNAQFPVRAIGSGSVVLKAWLTSLSGLEIGEEVSLQMVANPDIETAAIVLFMSFVGILIVIGIIRTLRRKQV